jgi:hypothetical protein
MRYSLQLHGERVVTYLLSREARVRIFANLHDDLGENADAYRLDPQRRLGAGSDCFWFHLVLRSAGRVRRFSFVVNDAAVVVGVLRIEYVDVVEFPTE